MRLAPVPMKGERFGHRLIDRSESSQMPIARRRGKLIQLKIGGDTRFLAGSASRLPPISGCTLAAAVLFQRVEGWRAGDGVSSTMTLKRIHRAFRNVLSIAGDHEEGRGGQLSCDSPG
jgi:hypothetical protein